MPDYSKRHSAAILAATKEDDPEFEVLDSAVALPGRLACPVLTTTDLSDLASDGAVPAAVSTLLASAGAVQGEDAIEFTLIASRTRATKAYGKDSAGKWAKASEPTLSDGTFHRGFLPPAAPLAALGAALAVFPSDFVLEAGALTVKGDNRTLVIKDRLKATPGAVARVKGHAAYRPGRPGLMVFDHDAKDLSDVERNRLKDAGGLLTVLASVCPEFGRAGVLVRPSVSNGIRDKLSGEIMQSGGLHIYSVARDGADAPRFVAVLHERLIAEGWGRAFITKNGTIKIRSLIDHQASGNPERLIFEANAVLDNADLEHVPGARDCAVERDGVRFDTSSLSDLTPEETAKLGLEDTRLRAAAKPEADRVCAEWVKQGAAALIATGMAAPVALARTARSAASGTVDCKTVLYLDDDSTPVVEDVLRDPARYKGKTCADPLEPDYGGGRNKAIVCVDSHLRVTIRSFAHGGQDFELRWSVHDLVEEWEKYRDPDRLAAMYPYCRIDGSEDEAALETAGVPTSIGLDFARDELRSLPRLVEQRQFSVIDRLKRDLRGLVDDKLKGLHDLGLVDGDAVREAMTVRPLPVRLSAGIGARPRFYRGEQDPFKGGRWLIYGLLPERGVALIAGQSRAGKTFVALDLAVSIISGQPFTRREVDRPGGVLFLAPEGAGEVHIRWMAAKAARRLGGDDLPFLWTDVLPCKLLDHGAAGKIADLAREAASDMTKMGVPLVAIIVDTLAVASGWTDENSNAEAQRAMDVLRSMGDAVGALVIAIDHYGKDAGIGTRGASSKGANADAVLAVLAAIDPSGAVTDRRMVIAKCRGAKEGETNGFALKDKDRGQRHERPRPDDMLCCLVRFCSCVGKGSQALPLGGSCSRCAAGFGRSRQRSELA